MIKIRLEYVVKLKHMIYSKFQSKECLHSICQYFKKKTEFTHYASSLMSQRGISDIWRENHVFGVMIPAPMNPIIVFGVTTRPWRWFGSLSIEEFRDRATTATRPRNIKKNLICKTLFCREKKTIVIRVLEYCRPKQMENWRVFETYVLYKRKLNAKLQSLQCYKK